MKKRICINCRMELNCNVLSDYYFFTAKHGSYKGGPLLASSDAKPFDGKATTGEIYAAIAPCCKLYEEKKDA